MSSLISEIDKTLDFLGEGFKGLTKSVKDISGDFTSGIKNFGLEVEEVAKDVGNVFEAGFTYVEETAEFFGEFGLNAVDLIWDLLKDLIKLLPYLIRFLKSCLKLLEYSFPIMLVLLFLSPALSIYYYTTYYIQILERRY
jgi:hypothetical protein